MQSEVQLQTGEMSYEMMHAEKCYRQETSCISDLGFILCIIQLQHSSNAMFQRHSRYKYNVLMLYISGQDHHFFSGLSRFRYNVLMLIYLRPRPAIYIEIVVMLLIQDTAFLWSKLSACFNGFFW
jgi:hypothetical protein